MSCDPEFQVSSVAAPVRRQIEEKLRTAILDGRFGPGKRLIERELCALLNVSRTPVREALRQLEAEGLVTVIPYRGPIVTGVSLDDVRQIYEVREVLEGVAGRGFVKYATDKQRAQLKKNYAQLVKAVRAKRYGALLGIKEQFYVVLFEGCGNTVVKDTLLQLNNRIRFLRATTLSDPARPPKTVSEMQKVVTAIAARDADAAWIACVNHVRSAAAVALKVLQEPGYGVANERRPSALRVPARTRSTDPNTHTSARPSARQLVRREVL